MNRVREFEALMKELLEEVKGAITALSVLEATGLSDLVWIYESDEVPTTN